VLEEEFKMSLLQVISYGTERYPPMVARRLCVVNFGCWAVASMWLAFAVIYLPEVKLRTVVIIDLVMAAVVAAIPLLHRVGPQAAPIAFLLVGYLGTFIVCFLLGTDSGMQMQYMAYAACAVLILGLEPLYLPILFGVLALALTIALEVFAPRDGGLLSKEAMLASFIGCAAGTGTIMFAVVFYAVWRATRAELKAESEYQRSEGLLLNILPAAVADRLKTPIPQVIADRYEDASVLFADMAGSTAAASAVAPADFVMFLNKIFTAFDCLVERHGLEKIKTTGDGYIVVSGVPVERPDHATALIQFAIEMLNVAAQIHDLHGHSLSIRIGLASGPVVAGVVGTKKFFYDVWGDTVNIASRMESTGLPGRIQVSSGTYERVKEQFEFDSRGPVDVKGKGQIATWFVIGRKSECAQAPVRQY
jgi:adenylate cyclase